jgi:hypothetical protein
MKYKKGVMNRLENMISQPPLMKIARIGMTMQLQPFTHELMGEDYERDKYFRGVCTRK